jgi:hypothetical protein
VSARIPFPYKTDHFIEFVSSADLSTNDALDNTNDGATCSYRIFDPAIDEVTVSGLGAASTSVNVTNADLFNTGDTIEIALDDGTTHLATLTSVADPTLFFSGHPAPSAAAIGSRARYIFGTEVDMPEFGTAVFGKRDYGFREVLAYDHVVQILDQEFNAEVTFVGAVAGGLNAFDIIYGVIKPRSECDCP